MPKVGLKRAYWLAQKYCSSLLVFLLLLAACGSNSPPATQPLPVATLMPTRAVVMPTPLSTPSIGMEPSDSGWLEAQAGVALRRLRVLQGTEFAAISIVRVDPRQVRFRVGYSPDKPRGIAAWRAEAGALAAINGGFFDQQNRSTALVIDAGVASGESYQGRGGMFAVDSSGAVSLRYLAEQPYDPGEPLSEVIQSWPMLIKPGGALAYTGEDTELARRSVIALDREGHVLLITCATSSFTLRSLADWLLAGDLQIDAALNLDGGASTAMQLESGAHHERIDSFVPLPLVLLVLPQ